MTYDNFIIAKKFTPCMLSVPIWSTSPFHTHPQYYNRFATSLQFMAEW